MNVRQFIKNNFKHFNAAVLLDAAEGWVQYLKKGNKMFLAMAGALSTGEIGITLAEMIRQDKIHGICCTGANLEEDIFNLIDPSNLSFIEKESLRSFYDKAYNSFVLRNFTTSGKSRIFSEAYTKLLSNY